MKATKQTFRDCPQGSNLRPITWQLIADTALKENWGNSVKIQTFTDYFILILKAKRKYELINLVNKIKDFKDWITKNDRPLN